MKFRWRDGRARFHWPAHGSNVHFLAFTIRLPQRVNAGPFPRRPDPHKLLLCLHPTAFPEITRSERVRQSAPSEAGIRARLAHDSARAEGEPRERTQFALLSSLSFLAEFRGSCKHYCCVGRRGNEIDRGFGKNLKCPAPRFVVRK